MTKLGKAASQGSAQDGLIDEPGQPASSDTREAEASWDLRWLLEPSLPARPWPEPGPGLAGLQTRRQAPETPKTGQAPSAVVQDAFKGSKCALGAASACLWWPALRLVAIFNL